MNKQFEIKIYDSIWNLPENPWKEQIIDFEKMYAVRCFSIFTYDEQCIAGFMRVLRNPDVAVASNWYICDVHTQPEYQHMGIATKMYEAAFEFIKEYDAASSITASVSASNIPSIGLHKKLGFRDSKEASHFADFCFEADETLYHFWLAKLSPARNNPTHLNLLRPMWIDYMKEIGEDDSDIHLIDGLFKRINISVNHENIFFDIIWSGYKPVGFAFYSVDGGIQNLIPAGYGYIMEFYLLPQWRGRQIATHVVKDICDKLKGLGCPKVYLTAVSESDGFWKKMHFCDSGLTDPDNQLSILLTDL